MIVFSVVSSWYRLIEPLLHEIDKMATKSVVMDLPSVCLYKTKNEITKEMIQLLRQTPSFLRIESHGNSMWMCGEAFSELGQKDLLVEVLLSYGLDHVIPTTTLLPWDADDADQIILPTEDGGIFLLKAALGCQGNGISFVKSKGQVLEIVKIDADNARNENNFLECLEKRLGRIPKWSLQTHIKSMLVNERKFHVRTYILIDHSFKQIFAYDNYEVRLACSPYSNIDETSDDRNVHITNGGGTNDTMRVMMSELPQLDGMDTNIKEFIRGLFCPPLKDYLLSRESPLVHQFPNCRIFSFAALDLMIDSDKRVWLLEVNARCPGAPSEGFGSGMFQKHLKTFCDDLVNITWLDGHPELFTLI